MDKIMIVEDEKSIRDLLASELKKRGFQTFATTDFSKVYDDFIKEEPKLIY